MIRILVLVVLFISNLAYSQSYYEDAIRFSNTNPLGSARIQALGGASVALGADPSAIISNPAGLGLYNSWEVSLTPAMNFTNTNATLNGSGRSASNTKFSLDQISFILSNPERVVSEIWLGGSWGFGVQKINDFNNTISYSGINSSNSLIDYFIESSNGYPASDFPTVENAWDLTSLAYYNYLIGPWNVIDPTFPDDEYFSDVTSFYKPAQSQTELIETSGSQYEIALGYGGNFEDVFYFGFNVALTTVNYESLKTYTESNYDYSSTDSATYLPLHSFTATEKLVIDGIGANFTFGVIIRPSPSFRLGLSFATPTNYSLDDSYETTLGAEWNNFFYEDIIGGDTLLNSTFLESAIVESIYTLKTPTKISLGAAFFLGKLGFITLDSEFLNYSRTSLESQDFSMEKENFYIKTNYSNHINIKTGIEIRLSPLRLRAGYALNNIPIDKQNNLKFSNHKISTGIGLLFDKIYTDFALVYASNKAQYSPYLLSDYSEPIVDINSNTISGIFTLGFKF